MALGVGVECILQSRRFRVEVSASGVYEGLQGPLLLE